MMDFYDALEQRDPAQREAVLAGMLDLVLALDDLGHALLLRDRAAGRQPGDRTPGGRSAPLRGARGASFTLPGATRPVTSPSCALTSLRRLSSESRSETSARNALATRWR